MINILDDCREITESQLDNLLVLCTENVPHHDTLLKSIFYTCYNTGLRVNELLNISKINVLIDGDYLIQTSKSGGNRIIAKNLILPEVQHYWNSKDNTFPYTTKVLNYEWARNMPHIWFRDKKSIHSWHAYRYNYIKRISHFYNDIEALAQHIGHVNSNTTQGYLDAKIYIDEFTYHTFITKYL
jgi:integrase